MYYSQQVYKDFYKSRPIAREGLKRSRLMQSGKNLSGKGLRALRKLLAKATKLKHQFYREHQSFDISSRAQRYFPSTLKAKQEVKGSKTLLGGLCSNAVPRQVSQINRRYKRTYLRRRVRASAMLKKRARLRRFIPVR